jgi:hypothetical protein
MQHAACSRANSRAILCWLSEIWSCNFSVNITFDQLFACEIEAPKQEFIRRTSRSNPNLLFQNVKDLESGLAFEVFSQERLLATSVSWHD